MTTHDIAALRREATAALEMVRRALVIAAGLEDKMHAALRTEDPRTEAGRACELTTMGIIRLRTHLGYVAEKIPTEAFELWQKAVSDAQRAPEGLEDSIACQVPA